MAQQVKTRVYSNFVWDEIILEGNLLKHRVPLRLLSVAVKSTTTDHERLEEERLISLYSLPSSLRRRGRNQGPQRSVAAEATEECWAEATEESCSLACSLVCSASFLIQPWTTCQGVAPPDGRGPPVSIMFSQKENHTAGSCHQALCPELDHRVVHGGRQELTPEWFPMTSTCDPWHVHIHMSHQSPYTRINKC